MKRKRCDFSRTDIIFGPRNGIKSKRWRCTRKSVAETEDMDSEGRFAGMVHLCGQHLKIVQETKREFNRKYR